VLADAAQRDAAVAQAEAALAEARSNLDKTRAAGRPSEIAAQRARIESLALLESIARRDAERSERLVPSGAGAASSGVMGGTPATRIRWVSPGLLTAKSDSSGIGWARLCPFGRISRFS